MDWAFYNASGGAYVIGQGGGAMEQHANCVDIEWDKVQPGDLLFYPEMNRGQRNFLCPLFFMFRISDLSASCQGS